MPGSGLLFLTTLAARTAIVLVVLVVGIRVFGKREIGGINVYDLVLVLAVANAVQNAMTKSTSLLLGGLVTSGTLLLLGWLVSRIEIRHPKFEAQVCGTTTILVQDGKLVEPNLRREGITADEVMAAVREYGLSRLEQVKLAVLELDGSLSVVPREKDS